MPRSFNTAGPCRPDTDYMLPPSARLPGVVDLIDQQKYFVLHAPRQAGKTTAFRALATELTESGRYVAVLLSMEVGAAFPDDPGAAEGASLDDWHAAARAELVADLQPPPWPDAKAGAGIGAALEAWSTAAPRPLVALLDEIDVLQDQTLISVLRQIRAGYPRRPKRFPWSLALIGLRDVRDYKIAEGAKGRLGTASPFNIKVESITLRDFTHDDVAALYQQHTDDTGQAFTPDAVARAFELTQGQPWLVNALARQAVEVVVPDRTQPVTHAAIDAAKEILIQRQDTHFDSLAERMREPRVRAVIDPALAHIVSPPDVTGDDVRYALDLGLARWGAVLEVANPIYEEVLRHIVSGSWHSARFPISPTWLSGDGRVEIEQMIRSLLAFWTLHKPVHRPVTSGGRSYPPSPESVFLAYLRQYPGILQQIEVTTSVGDRATAALVCAQSERFGIGLEMRSDGEPDPQSTALAHLDEYLAYRQMDTGWLVIFDDRSDQPPIEDRTSAAEAVTPSGRRVTVVRA